MGNAGGSNNEKRKKKISQGGRDFGRRSRGQRGGFLSDPNECDNDCIPTLIVQYVCSMYYDMRTLSDVGDEVNELQDRFFSRFLAFSLSR